MWVTHTTPQVAHVKEKVERMKAVRTLEWELDRLDMYVCIHTAMAMYLSVYWCLCVFVCTCVCV